MQKKYEKSIINNSGNRGAKKGLQLIFIWLKFENDERPYICRFVFKYLRASPVCVYDLRVRTFVCFVQFWSLTKMVRFKWIVNWLIVYWPYSRNTIDATEKKCTLTHMQTQINTWIGRTKATAVALPYTFLHFITILWKSMEPWSKSSSE